MIVLLLSKAKMFYKFSLYLMFCIKNALLYDKKRKREKSELKNRKVNSKERKEWVE